jgi:hypothetical protein
MLGEFEHGRPFVVGMNGTFSGVFIPQMIPIDTVFAGPAVLPEALGAPEAGAPQVSVFAAPIALVLPDLLDFGAPFAPQSAPQSFDVFDLESAWDAPASPVSTSYDWNVSIAASWFDAQPFESTGWDFFLY